MGRTIPPSALVEPVLAGQMFAIARLMTHAESAGESCQEALAEIYRHTGKAHIVGVTGVPGSGKSALVTQLCKALRARQRRVGVIAIDPSSPFSGGSILGDRIRMNELVTDAGVFIRSMATRGALGGLARAALSGVDILDAAGYDVVLIETVGVGQDEIDVVQAVHTTLVVSAPGLGDDIQAIKAGVLEIADIHVVGKCDRPDANRTVTDIRNMLMMGEQSVHGPAGAGTADRYDWQVPLIPTSSVNGEGIQELLSAIDSHLEALKSSGHFERRRRRIAETRLLKSAENILRDQFEHHHDHKISELTDQMMSGGIHPHAAAQILLNQFRSERKS